MKVTLPFPPSANRYWRNYQGRMVRSDEATSYIKEATYLCRGLQLRPYTGEVWVSLDFFRPAKRGDLDNLLKVTLDALRGWAYEDDKQIVNIVARRYEDRHNPRVEIVIQEVE